PSARANPCRRTAARGFPAFQFFTITALPAFRKCREALPSLVRANVCVCAHLPSRIHAPFTLRLARAAITDARLQGGTMHLLLVDGHPIALETLGAVAKGSFAGACVDSASGLAEAFEKARSAPPIDLVVLDPRLPG